jgi:hypothetical protein
MGLSLPSRVQDFILEDARVLTRRAFTVHSGCSWGAEKPMKILRFPVRPGPGRNVAGRIASVERLLSEYLSRQSSLREDGRRLRASLERLSVLTRDMVRSTELLRRSAGRLGACHRRIGPPAPPA